MHDFLQLSDTFSSVDPNILLSIMYTNTFNLRSSLKVTDQVLRPYKITRVLYFNLNVLTEILSMPLSNKLLRFGRKIVEPKQKVRL